MLKILNNFLSEEELKYLKNLTNDFIIDEKKQMNNQYDRMIIKDNTFLKSYQLKLNNYLKNLNNEYVQSGLFWITKVDNSNTKIDPFHMDISDLTFVSYFDINFKGGNFEYIDETGILQSIVPKTNMTLLMTNKVPHRITPVTDGNRHSLVILFSLKEKTNKTLL